MILWGCSTLHCICCISKPELLCVKMFGIFSLAEFASIWRRRVTWTLGASRCPCFDCLKIFSSSHAKAQINAEQAIRVFTREIPPMWHQRSIVAVIVCDSQDLSRAWRWCETKHVRPLYSRVFTVPRRFILMSVRLEEWICLKLASSFVDHRRWKAQMRVDLLY